MDEFQPSRITQAVHDFQNARRKAALESLIAALRGRSADLLPYDTVRQHFRAIESARRTLEDIPIDKIIGSVGRYHDFSRSFLPRQESDAHRWASVRLGMERLEGLPPIEAYKVGDVYFILDGHHRVSVARDMGSKSIEGYVIPVYTRVPLSPGDRPDDLILKSEYDAFLSQTRLDESRLDANLMLTAPGQYPRMLEHIAVHQYFLGQQRGQPVSFPDAAASWFDTVYQPITQLIRERNLLRDFPHRTEADLYLWIMEHRAAISGGQLGWEVAPGRAADDLAENFSPTAHRVLPRLARKITNWLVPDSFEAGPPPGVWRAERLDPHRTERLDPHRAERLDPHRGDRLFDDILVTVPGGSDGWPAVEMGVAMAAREEARLTGLHMVRLGASKDTPEVEMVREAFLRRCAEAGVAGRLLVEEGPAAERLCQRSVWVDLVVFRMNYPPPTQPWKRLRSGARTIIRRCPVPIFAVPEAPFLLNSALLAYGPGRMADEALFVATYLAGRWNIALTVLTVEEPDMRKTRLDDHGAISPSERARSYLEAHGVQAQIMEERGPLSSDPARAILFTAEAREAGFIIMGGYEAGPLRESLTGSTTDRVLRSTRRPVLICR